MRIISPPDSRGEASKSNSNLSLEEFDFEIIDRQLSMSEAASLLQDFENLPQIVKVRIKNKIEEIVSQALKKFITNFKNDAKRSITKIKIINIATPVLVFLYAGPLSAIFSRVVLEVVELRWLIKKFKSSVEYFPKEDIMIDALIKEMKEEQLAIAKEVFFNYADKKPENLEDANKLYKELAFKYHADRNSATNAKEIFQKVENAYSLFRKYSSLYNEL